MTPRITPFPSSGASCTHTTAHTTRVSLLLPWIYLVCLQAVGRRDLTRLDRVRSTMPPGGSARSKRTSGESRLSRSADEAHSELMRATHATRRALHWPLVALRSTSNEGRDRAGAPDPSANASNSRDRPCLPTWLMRTGNRRRLPLGGSSMLACGTVGEPSHIITRRVHGYVSFRNIGPHLQRCSSVLVSVSLCGSAPISAIESLGSSGRGGQGDPCPEGCVLGPQLGEAFSQQLELFFAASTGGAQAVQFRPDPIEPALCRLVSSTLGL